MDLSIFEFLTYRKYLKKALSKEHSPRGARANLAKYLGCQTSFLSQVLTDRAHLSLEHAIKVSGFLQHSPSEQNYFMLLVQKEKAGSKDLIDFFENQIEDVQKQRQIVGEKIKVTDKVNPIDQSTYYSTWWYSAIHISVALPHINSQEDLVAFLGLPPEVVNQALKFLIKIGLVVKNGNSFQIGKSRIHLSPDSPHLYSHHRNWRQKTIESLEGAEKSSLHFTGVLGLSKADAIKVKSLMLELIKKSEKYIKDSEDEDVYVYLLDFFKLGS